MDSEKNKILEGFLIGLLSALDISVGWYGVSVGLSMKKDADISLTAQVKKNNNNPEAISEKSQLSSQPGEPFVDNEYVIKKGEVKWLEPKEVGDLGLTEKYAYTGGDRKGVEYEYYSNGVKYVKVGEVLEGKYSGAEVFDVISWIYEWPSDPDILRILKFNSEYVFLTRNTVNFSEYMTDYIKKYFFKGDAEKRIDDKIFIEELSFPKEFKGQNDRQQFVMNEYDNAFFTPEKLKLAFTKENLGKVWMTDILKVGDNKATQFELNSYYSDIASDGDRKKYNDIFGRNGFYLKSPDGLAISYRLILDVIGVQNRFSRLLAVWNDGSENQIDYETYPGGCGLQSYVYNKTLEINLKKDAVLIGKTKQGDNLYGYKDVNHPNFKKLYEEIYWVENGKKKSLEDFLKMNPEVFWVDPFGRTLAFYRQDIISPAECGKPVIYLYPEKPMNISVQVSPGGGIRVSEPNYGNGWKVFSDEKSDLINLADGKTYPYLFWEGSGSVFYEMPKQGFVVAKDGLDAFFEEKLLQLGLNEKEKNDFKEFWLPKMSDLEKPYYFVTFLPKRYIDALAPLSIEPEPETVIRVLMDYRGLYKQESVESLPITTPERKGFTAVEWGGFLK